MGSNTKARGVRGTFINTIFNKTMKKQKQKQENEELLAYVEKIDSALKAWVEDGEKDETMRAYLIVATEKTDKVDDEGNDMCRSLFSVTNRGMMLQYAILSAMRENDDFRHFINCLSFESVTGIIKDIFSEKGDKK